MPKFTVEHPTSSDAQETFIKLKEFFTTGTEIKKIDPKVECSFNEQKQTCSLKGSQFKAEVTIVPTTGGSKVSITIDLPLLLSPFKGKVSEGLQKMLKKHLG